jgi:hypothetical protein
LKIGSVKTSQGLSNFTLTITLLIPEITGFGHFRKR